MPLYERIFDLYPQSVLVFESGSGTICRVNPAVEKLLDIGAKALLKMRIWDLFAASDAPVMRRTVKGNDFHRREKARMAFMERPWNLDRLDGAKVPVRLKAESVGGKLVFLVIEPLGTSQDERSSAKEIAFQELLRQMEEQGELIRRELRRRIEKFVLPGLKKLKGRAPRKEDRKYFDALERHLAEAFRGNQEHFTDKLMQLSVREAEICNFIRYGMSSKEIAETLNVSPVTIETQRNRIRKKLGLTNRRINLVSYLQRMEA